MGWNFISLIGLFFFFFLFFYQRQSSLAVALRPASGGKGLDWGWGSFQIWSLVPKQWENVTYKRKAFEVKKRFNGFPVLLILSSFLSLFLLPSFSSSPVTLLMAESSFRWKGQSESCYCLSRHWHSLWDRKFKT